MRKIKIILYSFALFIANSAYGQLTGIKTIPGDYATLSAAISSLNAQGVGAGGVTFNIAAGYTETFASSTSGLITATGTAANPIVFQKSGTGANPQITAGPGVSDDVDGIIVIKGGDYVTFDNINIAESSLNTSSTPQMEWGFAMVKESATNGAQHNVIKNCVITMQRVGSVGIYAGNHTNLNVTSLSIATIAGTNSYNKIDGDTIKNAYYGISFKGYYYFSDQSNEFGVISGNTIRNISTSNGAGIGLMTGIYIESNSKTKISNNSISTSNAYATTCYSANGICIGSSKDASIDIINNTISISKSINEVAGIYANDVGPNDTVNIINNKIQNCLLNNSTAGTFSGIYINGVSTLNVINNQIINNSLSGTGQFNGIFGGGSVCNIRNNTISGNGKISENGIMQCAYVSGSISTFTGNTITQNSINATTSSAKSELYGCRLSYSLGNDSVSNNTITDLTFTSSSYPGDFIYGIYDIGDSSIICDNIISGLKFVNTISSTGVVHGVLIKSYSYNETYNNRINNLEVAGYNSTAIGVTVDAVSNSLNTRIFNNFISELKAPTSNNGYGICGIKIRSSNNLIAHNTIYLAASSNGFFFNSAGLLFQGGTIDLRNNIIINKSIPGINGITYGIINYNNESNYLESSNNNCIYAGTPSSSNVIYYCNSQNFLTMNDFLNHIYPRETLSFSEDVQFENTTTSPYDLHINSAIPTFCESFGIQVNTPINILDDIDGNVRNANPDIGADEFDGTALGVIYPSSVSANHVNSQKIRLAFTPNPSNNNVVIVWNTTGVFTAPSGPPPTQLNSAFAGGFLLYNGVSAPIMHSGLTNETTYYYRVYSYNGTIYSSGISVNATTGVNPPAAIESTTLSASKIYLEWIKNNGNEDVVISSNLSNTFGHLNDGVIYSLNDTISGGGKIIYNGPASSFVHEGLTNGTHYYYKSWSKDEYNAYSITGPLTDTITFLCDNINTYPYTEQFNDTLNNPLCWTVSHNNGDTPIWFVCSKGTTPVASPHSPGGLIRFISGSYPSNGLLFSRPFDLPTSSYQVSFWMFRDDYRTAYLDKVNVYINSTPSTVGAILLGTVNRNSLLAPAEAVNNQWYRYSFDFPSGSAGIGKYLIFQGVGQIGNDIYVDDIKIDTISACAMPTALFANTMKDTSAILHWSAGGSENNWEIEYGSTGFVQGNGTIVSSDSTNYLLTGLTPNTMYSFFVRSRCNESTRFSHWSGPYYFQTECEQVTVFPFEENFDSEIFKPVCWKNFQSAGPGYLKRWGRTTAEYCDDFIVPYRGTGMAIFDSYSFEDGVKALLITPSLNLHTDLYQVNFWMYRDGNSVKDSLNIYFNTLPAAGGTLIGTINRCNSLAPVEQMPEEWYHYSFNFPSGSAGNYKYVIFEGVSKSGSYLAIDDVQIDVQAPCPKPTSLSSQTILGTDTRISWVAGSNETSWEIEYGLAGFSRGSGTFITTDHNSDTLTGLSQGTSYSYFVRARCSGVGESSLWAGPFYITTPITCYGPSSITSNNITRNSATINWYQGSTVSSWNIQYAPTGDSLGSGTIVNAISKPYTINGLHGDTQYTYYLQSTCGGVNGNSVWVGPNTFWTMISCYSPIQLRDTLITQNSITLNWEDIDNVNPSLWEIEYGPAGFTSGNGTVISTSSKPYTISGLLENTSYSFRVRTNCGVSDGYSRWTLPITSKTSCAQITSFPFVESFDDTLFVNCCWINKASEGSDSTYKWARSTHEYYPNCFPHSGSGMAKSFAPAGKSILVTPALQLPTDSFQVKFWMFRDSEEIQNKDSVNVYYNSQPNLENAIKFGTINRQYSLSPTEETYNQWYHYTFNFPVGSMGDYRYVIFEAVNKYGNPILIDDLEIGAPKSCKTPSNLGTTSVSDSFANITWTSEGNESSWNIEYGLAGFSQGSGTTAVSSSNPFLISGLQPTTTYAFYVKADCGESDDESDWAGPYYFTTTVACPIPTSLNVINTLSTSVTLSWNPGNLEDSWQIQYGSAGFNLGTGITITTTSNPYTLSGLTPGFYYEFYVRANCDNGDASYWAGPYFFAPYCSQPIDLYASDVTSTSALLGWNGGSIYESYWDVNYGLAGFSPSTGIWHESHSNQYSVSGLLPNSNYEFYVVAFCNSGTGSIWSTNNWAGPFPFSTKCTPVLTPTATSLSPTSVSLGWISTSTATLWNIRYKKALDNTYSLISNVSTNPYILSGLEQNTAYLWNVNTNCGNDVSSAWSSDNTFNTPVGISETARKELSVFSSNKQINVINKDHVFIDEVVILDLLGNEIDKYFINSADNIFINTNLSAANYLIKVKTNTNIGVYKLFIQ